MLYLQYSQRSIGHYSESGYLLDTCGRASSIRIRHKKYPDSKISGYVWTEPGRVKPPGPPFLYRNLVFEQEVPLWKGKGLFSVQCSDYCRAVAGVRHRGQMPPSKFLSLATAPKRWYFFFIAAIDGKLSDWGDWSECSVTCGTGTRSRDRTCTPPQHGGVECKGEKSETGSCNDGFCRKYMYRISQEM